jgi:hypothetical protein
MQSTTPRAPRVFHPPGTVRLVTPAEGGPPRPRAAAPDATGAADLRRAPTHRPTASARPDGAAPHEDIQMANFGVRTAYPVGPAPAPLARRPAGGLVARVLGALLRALDAAPYDLARPAAGRPASRA